MSHFRVKRVFRNLPILRDLLAHNSLVMNIYGVGEDYNLPGCDAQRF
jgi:hypothetical protein